MYNKTTNVYIVPFNEVSIKYAFKEGEGDKSLSYWRRVHTILLKYKLGRNSDVRE